MKTSLVLLILLLASGCLGRAQGTLVFDQQSATSDSSSFAITAISGSQPFGQSFTPAFSAIDFIRLVFALPTSGRAGASASGWVSINLWSGGISNGVLLASTEPVFVTTRYSLPPAYVFTNFFFAAPVTVTAGATYFFQPFVQSEVGSLQTGIFNSIFYPATYPGGQAFQNGFAGGDLWFREGIIVVPEPAAGGIFLVAAVAWLALGMKNRSSAN